MVDSINQRATSNGEPGWDERLRCRSCGASWDVVLEGSAMVCDGLGWIFEHSAACQLAHYRLYLHTRARLLGLAVSLLPNRDCFFCAAMTGTYRRGTAGWGQWRR